MTEHNPYAPTQGALNMGSLGEQKPSAELAPRWRRVVNLFVDLGAYLLLSLLIGAVNVIASVHFRVDFVGLTGRFFGLVVLFLYYFLSEALLGKTVGKFMTRTRVVSESGARRPRLGQIFARTICRFVPLEALSFLGRYPRGWHDQWSGTSVVIVRRS